MAEMFPLQQKVDFVPQRGRPRPRAGYKCKICGQAGGEPDSHWYQLCPSKGATEDNKNFNPPRKGYICKFCHKEGGEPDSHWFQQCPHRHQFEGVKVPHPLKLRAANAIVEQSAQVMQPGYMSPQQMAFMQMQFEMQQQQQQLLQQQQSVFFGYQQQQPAQVISQRVSFDNNQQDFAQDDLLSSLAEKTSKLDISHGEPAPEKGELNGGNDEE